MDSTAAFSGALQGAAALRFAPTASAFARAPGIATGLSLIETAVAAIGVESVVGRLAGYAVKLSLRSDEAAERAAAQMVDAMRARVPQDTGRLLNGITWSMAGGMITVEASAINERSGFDYARAIEFGHQIRGGTADSSFFGEGDDGSALRGASGSEVQPEPYFWPSAREGLSAYRQELNGVIVDGAREGGF